MRGLKWVVAILIVCVLVVAGARMRSGRAESDATDGLDTHTVSAVCMDPGCGWTGEVEVPLGSVVDQVRCPKCNAWDPRKLSDSGKWGVSSLRMAEPPEAAAGAPEKTPEEAEE